MHKVNIVCNWGGKYISEFFGDFVNFESSKQVNLYIDSVPKAKSKSSLDIVWVVESRGISNSLLGGVHSKVVGSYENFDYVLTHDEDLLSRFPDKAIQFLYGSTWIKDYSFPEKVFGVSTVVGHKSIVSGHHIRKDLWNRQGEIVIPKNFFMSSRGGSIKNFGNNPRLGDDKLPLFDNMFHIVIENEYLNNWFTEKIMDCFQTKTIPIYWGCPNIGQWFNGDGIIMVSSVDEIIEACNALTPDIYTKKIKELEENYILSKEYCNLSDRIINKVKGLL